MQNIHDGMKNKVILFIGCLLFFQGVFAQLTLEDCYEKAESNYPLIKQYDLIEKTRQYNLSNASKGYLPQIHLAAQASYQSDVTQIPIDIPGIKGLSKDQYAANLEVNQTLWDGGAISSSRKNIKTLSEVDQRQLEVTLYAVREQVNQLFFGVLLHDEMLNHNEVYLNELQRNIKQVSVFIENGVANSSDLDAVELERAKALQQQAEFTHNRQTYLAMLSALIGETLSETTQLKKPDVETVFLSQNFRPELTYFAAQQSHLEAQRKQVNAQLMPQISAFIRGGYGRPGLNMLESKFSAYYMGGVRLAWNISSLYNRKNNLQMLDIGSQMINTQRETFLFNTHLELISGNNDIQKLQKLLSTDEDIIRLRTSIKKASEAKMTNGTLSVLDYMKEVNAEQLAIQAKIIHQIQWMQAIYNIKYVTNN